MLGNHWTRCFGQFRKQLQIPRDLNVTALILKHALIVLTVSDFTQIIMNIVDESTESRVVNSGQTQPCTDGWNYSASSYIERVAAYVDFHFVQDDFQNLLGGLLHEDLNGLNHVHLGDVILVFIATCWVELIVRVGGRRRNFILEVWRQVVYVAEELVKKLVYKVLEFAGFEDEIPLMVRQIGAYAECRWAIANGDAVDDMG